MSLTADVKLEIMKTRAKSTQARAAEISSILRFGGGLQLISGRIAVEAQTDSQQLARRIGQELLDLYGVRAKVSIVAGTGGRPGERFLVRVFENGETLARQTGLMDARRRTVRGLPNRLTTGNREDLAGIWRGAFLAAGSLTDPGRSNALEVITPNAETAMALVGAANRLGIGAKAREVRNVHRVVIRDGEEIAKMLKVLGARETVEAWEQMRQRRETRATANRLVNFDDANLRRSAQAAVTACARVERALEILGDEAPEHLAYAGKLRVQYRDASLDELGRHAEPPMTKDAVAGRIRRLLALADKRAHELGVPDTSANLPNVDDM